MLYMYIATAQYTYKFITFCIPLNISYCYMSNHISYCLLLKYVIN